MYILFILRGYIQNQIYDRTEKKEQKNHKKISGKKYGELKTECMLDTVVMLLKYQKISMEVKTKQNESYQQQNHHPTGFFISLVFFFASLFPSIKVLMIWKKEKNDLPASNPNALNL